MLPLLRDQVKVFLAPTEMIVRHTKFSFLSKNVTLTTLRSTDVVQASDWSATLVLFEQAMRKLESVADVSVVISNAFIRYQLIPAQIALNSYEEESSYVNFNFAEVYGDALAKWTLSWGPGLALLPQVACAIDRELLAQLTVICKRYKCRLVSAQPYLNKLFNLLKKKLKKETMRFLDIEDGRLCAGFVNKGVWTSLRCSRFEGHWQEMLPAMIEREFLLTDMATLEDELLLCVPQKFTMNFSPSGPVRTLVVPPLYALLDNIPMNAL